MLSAIATPAPGFENRPFPYYSHPAINGFNIPQSMYQQPSQPDQHEALLGKKLTRTPSRLHKRVLYIPSHNDKVSHLPIYDFTKEYRQAVRDEPIGSSRFKTTFGLMPKPSGDGRGKGEVSYLVDFEPPEARRSLSSSSSGSNSGSPPASTRSSMISSRRSRRSSSVITRATVRRRMLYGGAEVDLTIPPRRPHGVGIDDDSSSDEDDESSSCLLAAPACTVTPASTEAPIDVATSHPVEPTVSRWGSSRNSWFTYTIPSLLNEERTLQWQVHPAEHGMLRYTLVEIPKNAAKDEDKWWEDNKEDEKAGRRWRKKSKKDEKPAFSASEDENQHLIRAIYHNVGLGFSLSQPYSEGALLMQNDFDPETEAIIVASLLGLLWTARGEECKPRRKNSKSEGSVLSRKKSPSVASVDEKRSASRSPSPGKKGLIGKILRRMS